MKKAIVVILCILIAFGGGLLVYGATLGDAVTVGAILGELVPPEDPDCYAHGIAEWIAEYSTADYHHTLNVAYNPSKNPEFFAAEVDGWYDVFGKADPSTSILERYTGADLVAYLMIPVTYNHNRCKQFCMSSKYVITAEDQVSYSDNLRIRHQFKPAYVNVFYRSCAWTGAPITSFSSVRARYRDQSLKSLNNMVDGFDEETGVYDVKYRKPKSEWTDGELDREVPFKTYDLLSFPIYLGDGEDKANDINAKIDSSVVDGASVVLTAPTEAKPYYTLTFSEDLVHAQCKENTEDRINQVFGGQMKDITVKKADFVVEIWECGLFRQVSADIEVNAKIAGSQGDATIKMDYKFYYDDKNCDVESMITSLGWVQYLNADNKAVFEEKKKS